MDFLVLEENVYIVLVYGIVYDWVNDIELVIGFFCINKLILDFDEFLKDSFGMDGIGCYYGGGWDMVGGFEILVGFLIGCND